MKSKIILWVVCQIIAIPFKCYGVSVDGFFNKKIARSTGKPHITASVLTFNAGDYPITPADIVVVAYDDISYRGALEVECVVVTINDNQCGLHRFCQSECGSFGLYEQHQGYTLKISQLTKSQYLHFKNSEFHNLEEIFRRRNVELRDDERSVNYIKLFNYRRQVLELFRIKEVWKQEQPYTWVSSHLNVSDIKSPNVHSSLSSSKGFLLDRFLNDLAKMN